MKTVKLELSKEAADIVERLVYEMLIPIRTRAESFKPYLHEREENVLRKEVLNPLINRTGAISGPQTASDLDLRH